MKPCAICGDEERTVEGRVETPERPTGLAWAHPTCRDEFERDISANVYRSAMRNYGLIPLAHDRLALMRETVAKDIRAYQDDGSGPIAPFRGKLPCGSCGFMFSPNSRRIRICPSCTRSAGIRAWLGALRRTWAQ